jgi:hypothetical protein
LGTLAEDAERALRTYGINISTTQEAPSFLRLRADDGSDVCLVDLVADPASPFSQPREVELDGQPLRVETRAAALVSKLCAFLGRSEIRDLIDIKALVEAGEDLEKAVMEAPRKDDGFSPLTLAWLLNEMSIEALARSEGYDESESRNLKDFRDKLVAILLSLSKPA